MIEVGEQVILQVFGHKHLVTVEGPVRQYRGFFMVPAHMEWEKLAYGRDILLCLAPELPHPVGCDDTYWVTYAGVEYAGLSVWCDLDATWDQMEILLRESIDALYLLEEL